MVIRVKVQVFNFSRKHGYEPDDLTFDFRDKHLGVREPSVEDRLYDVQFVLPVQKGKALCAGFDEDLSDVSDVERSGPPHGC